MLPKSHVAEITCFRSHMLPKSHNVVNENVVGGCSVLRVFPLVIAVSEQDMPGIKTGPLGCYNINLTMGYKT